MNAKPENWCLSGGARGSDLYWGEIASAKRHRVLHFSFEGHITEAPSDQLLVLGESALEAAEPFCIKAGQLLKRRFPRRVPVELKSRTAERVRAIRNLLLRNWYAVDFAGACYAISTFKMPLKSLPLGYMLRDVELRGGTAWTVGLFIQRHDGSACPCYVFEQNAGYWFKWEGDGWQRIYEPPQPSGIYAGVGLREINALGKLAIRVLMDYKANYHSDEYPFLRDADGNL